MGTMQFPYEDTKTVKQFIKRLEKPMYVVVKHDPDFPEETYLDESAIPNFYDDDLSGMLYQYHQAHPKTKKFDARTIVKRRLREMLQKEHKYFAKKGQLTSTSKAGSDGFVAANLLCKALRVRQLS